MNYNKLQYGPVQQDVELAYRQAKADQNMAPQADSGTYFLAEQELAEAEYDAYLDGSSQEQGR